MSKIKQMFLVIITLILTGCVTAQIVSFGDGSTGYEIRCSGLQNSIGDCRNKAAEVCGGKYTELSREETGSVLVQAKDRYLTVKCK
jgi:hypothetical protein